MQDTGRSRNTLDQFYTKPSVAQECIEHLPKSKSDDYTFIEPSAGDGSFYNLLGRDTIGIDMEPMCPGLIKADFLKWSPPPSKRKYIVVGNPPFGRQSRLAKAFIKHGCEIADIIAFILPRSFTKPSMFNAFDDYFHNIHSHDLKQNSFLLNGEEYDVPCVFQIWERKETRRAPQKNIKPIGFKYVKSSEPYDITFRRVGVYAGRCKRNDGTQVSVQSHHFIKFDDASRVDAVIERVNNHIFPTNTVGPRSLSKNEINSFINSTFSSSC